MSTRRAALDTLMKVTDQGAYANLALKQGVQNLSGADTRWVSAVVYTALENLLYIDHTIAVYARGKLKPQIRGILRLGVCQAFFMNTPHRVACDESVKLAKEIGKGALSGYVNAVMQSVCKGGLAELPQDPVLRMSMQYSAPEWLVRMYILDYGEAFAEGLLGAKLSGMTLRAQPPCTTGALADELARRGIPYTQGSLVKDALRIQAGFNVAADEWFTAGRYTVQSESAMLACHAVGVAPGMRVLDACAAPGGKTAYLSALMQGEGEIVACELHPHRTELMQRTLERLNVKNATALTLDAGETNPAFIDGFDAVLIDAPCSGLGVTGKPDIRLAKREEDIQVLTEVQKRILWTCSAYVKPGGALVYATCTVNKRENEMQMDAFLAAHADFYLEALEPYIPEGGSLQLFPHVHGTEGFFIARVRRREEGL